MRKIVTIVFLCVSCKQQCPELIVTKEIQVLRSVDTLVIIQTYDSIPESSIDKKSGMWIKDGGWTMMPRTLFKDGKRTDTIKRHTVIYY